MIGQGSGETIERLVLTSAGQRALDEAAVAAGVPSAELMESAGRSAADWILERLAPARVAVLVGPGGNGGDGLVVARRLADAGVDVETLLLQPGDRLGETSSAMLDRLERAGARPLLLETDGLADLDALFGAVDRVVDAIFGSGLSRPVGGLYREVIGRVNASNVPVVSLDLPSGLPSDHGKLLGPAVQADVTLAMEFLKPAHLLFPASGLCGNVAVVPVAYPRTVTSKVESLARVPERMGITRRLPRRRPDGHKGTFGRVLIVAGSVGMTGASIFACRGALRAGAGLVHLATPASLNRIVEVALPEAITIPLPEDDGRLVSVDDPRFEEVLEAADVLAVGPGLSRATVTGRAVRALIERFEGPIVLDADGLVAFQGHIETLRRAAGRLILTPHPGELARLLSEDPERIDADRIETARGFAREHGLVLVLKGRPTAIGLPDGNIILNPTGNSGLATGGTGDVLTGLIAGFVAGGTPLADAAVLSAYVHGLAAEAYARDRSERSMVPSDLTEVLPTVLREVETWG